MNKIQVLSVAVADKIAAGEVAERPSAVVKELVENSIDSGADEITVEIKKGGIEYIRIEDNGCGIPAEQAETAFLRHATSKLRQIDDLYSIQTMGFRGEALASICAVAEVEMITRTAEAEEGIYLKMVHGKTEEKQTMPCACGTTVMVKNLFANVPARMKFLKKDSTEAGYVADVLGRIALSKPGTAFKYICDGKEVFSTNGDGKLKNTVLRIYGLEHARALYDVDYTEDNIHVSGVIGKPELSRGNRTRQTLFVNGRYVKNHVAAKVVEEAYRNTVMVGRFPFFVLNIDVPSELVDVNVHPAKTEVKFANEKQIYDVCYHAARNAIYTGAESEATDAVPKISQKISESLRGSVAPVQSAERKAPYKAPGGDNHVNPRAVREFMKNTVSKDAELLPRIEGEMPVYVRESTPEPSELLELILESKKSDGDLSEQSAECEPYESVQLEMEETAEIEEVKNDFKIIGQVFDTYVIYQLDEKMFLIDQHAAHERVRFEELKKGYMKKEKLSQLLLVPYVLALDFLEKRIVMDNAINFRRLGFEIEDFGGNSIIIHGTPTDGDESEIRDLVLELAGAMRDNIKHPVADFEERALDMIACKYAIKANKKLSLPEMSDLIEKVEKMEIAGIRTCPHGRPIKVLFTKTDIERLFKRIV